ncbi:MAG: hypothetical protein SWO11_12395 [Thermodesulfobacteriota bacterium]|nr:hypothetical protein [Thermodesulfobacteriota bacterium]
MKLDIIMDIPAVLICNCEWCSIPIKNLQSLDIRCDLTERVRYRQHALSGFEYEKETTDTITPIDMSI